MNIPKQTLLITHRARPSLGWILLPIGLILIVSLSCNLPLGFLQSGSPVENLGEALIAGGLLNVEDISISESQVNIQYAQLVEEDSSVMIAGWLAAMQAAVQAAPEAGEIILLTTTQGEPYLEISALTDDVRAFSSGEISQEAFLDILQILDLRPLETRIFGRLVDQGLDVSSVSLSEENLVIEYYPAPAEDQAALMTEWLDIFGVVMEENNTVETIQIRALMLDTSVFVVEVGMADLEGFYTGELTAFDFLARLSITEEPVDLEE